jgi:hypothetical protein
VKKKIFLEFCKIMISLIFLLKKDFLTFDDSDYHSVSEFSEDVKIRCFDSCCNKTKTCSVLTKAEEQ